MANENVVMNNGDLTAVGRITGAKVRVPSAGDLEFGNNDTLSDLSTIRSGASAGATALQAPTDVSEGLPTVSTGMVVTDDFRIKGSQSGLFVNKKLRITPDGVFAVSTNPEALDVEISLPAVAGTIALLSQVLRDNTDEYAPIPYTVGSFCRYQGTLYVCNTATSGGSFDPTKWTSMSNVTSMFGTSNTALTDTISNTVPATALKPTTDAETYELDVGSSNPWDAKASTISCGTGESKQTVTVSNGDANVTPLFSSANTSLTSTIGSTIAARCQSLDPANSSISDVIKALKGIN